MNRSFYNPYSISTNDTSTINDNSSTNPQSGRKTLSNNSHQYDPSSNKILRITFLNVGHLQFPIPHKLQECVITMHNLNIDILCLSETGLNDHNYENRYLIRTNVNAI